MCCSSMACPEITELLLFDALFCRIRVAKKKPRDLDSDCSTLENEDL